MFDWIFLVATARGKIPFYLQYKLQKTDYLSNIFASMVNTINEDKVNHQIDAILELVNGEDISGPDFKSVLRKGFLFDRIVVALLDARLHWAQLQRFEKLERKNANQ